MYHFFVQKTAIEDDVVRITGEDYNHAVNVLRLRAGEEILVSDEDAADYLCVVAGTGNGPEGERFLEARVREAREENHELPSRVVLFQALLKGDNMELVIQKAVELGVSEIVPVEMKNCVMKLDPKKTASRVERWQKIAESAAKQSKRSIIPAVSAPVKFTDAVRMAEELDVPLIPYEQEKGMQTLAETMLSFLPGRSIGVFIGPEGGFDRLEAKHAMNRGVVPVSLGKRILRAETAAVAALSIVMIRLEMAAEFEQDG